MSTPRMRLFAGPNGSGKSALKTLLPLELLGIYLNPDDLEKELANRGGFHLESYGAAACGDDLIADLRNSEFLSGEYHAPELYNLAVEAGWLRMNGTRVNSYLAAAIVDFLRRKFVEDRVSFTFETVMSHPGKIALLKAARSSGFRTYLYYVATDDPEINVSRVKARVALGGHDVPEEKVRNRYHASLALLLDAVRQTNRAYLFDNSEEHTDKVLVAEITDGSTMDIKADWVPGWFQHSILDKLP